MSFYRRQVTHHYCGECLLKIPGDPNLRQENPRHFKGKGMISLFCKTYHCFGKTSITKTCKYCLTIQIYDKRTPGRFKLQYEGKRMISLCSKTYHCFGHSKTSTKGLSKHQNNFKTEDIWDVLKNWQSEGGHNMGFLTHGLNVYTYKQHRNSLSFF